MDKEQRPDIQGLIVEWYSRGHADMEDGLPFDPPENAYLRCAYANGWMDHINCVVSSPEELVKVVMG
jgi:hypothetical protein